MGLCGATSGHGTQGLAPVGRVLALSPRPLPAPAFLGCQAGGAKRRSLTCVIWMESTGPLSSSSPAGRAQERSKQQLPHVPAKGAGPPGSQSTWAEARRHHRGEPGAEETIAG